MRNALVVSIIVGTLTAAGFFLKSTDQSPSVVTRLAILEKPAIATQLTSEPVSLQYRFKRNIQAELAQKKWVNVQYEGELFVETSDSHQAHFKHRLKGEKKISPSVLVQFDREGKILTSSISKNASFTDESLSILKDLILLYTFEETRDTYGPYEAKIKKTDNIWIKEKISYKDSPVSILKSKHAKKMDPNGVFALSIEGQEETSLGQGQEKGLTTFSSYSIQRVPEEKTKTTRGWIPTHEPQEEISLVLQNSAPIYQVPAWDQLQLELSQWDEQDQKTRLRLFRTLTRSLATHPKDLKKTIAWMSSGGGRSDRLVFGIGILATVGTPQAQKQLLDFYPGATPEIQHTILGALTTTQVPLTPETKTFLNERLSENETQPDIAMSAAFALGASLKNQPDPFIEKALIARMEDATTPSDQLAYLDAMGNSGSTAFLPTIESALQSTNVAMREKAAYALRWYPAEQVSKLMNQALEDSHPRVQAQATLARQFQEP